MILNKFKTALFLGVPQSEISHYLNIVPIIKFGKGSYYINNNKYHAYDGVFVKIKEFMTKLSKKSSENNFKAIGKELNLPTKVVERDFRRALMKIITHCYRLKLPIQNVIDEL